jgi:hypothetical protein
MFALQGAFRAPALQRVSTKSGCFLWLQTDLKGAGVRAWIRAVCFSSMGVRPVETNEAFLQELRAAAGGFAMQFFLKSPYAGGTASSRAPAASEQRHGKRLRVESVFSSCGCPAFGVGLR